MPIFLPPELPAATVLRAEGIAVAEASQAPGSALRIGLVNLMPDRPTTETQFARLLGAAPNSVSLSLFTASGSSAARTPREHLTRFYTDLSAVREAPLDGLIITGAPVETLPFPEVRYWAELVALFDDAAARKIPTFAVCWAAMAALHHAHGVGKHLLARKAFGLYDQTVRDSAAPMMQGLGPRYIVPVSRHASIHVEDLAGTGARMLAGSRESGVSMAADEARGQTLLLDHFEYDGDTLISEFQRDRAAAIPAAPPVGLTREARADVPWRRTGHLVMRNWLGVVERAKAARRPPDLLGWLLAAGRDSAGTIDLVIRNDPDVDILPGLVAVAKECGITLAATSRHPQGVMTIAKLDPHVNAANAERLAQRAILLAGVREVMLRGPGAAGTALRAAA